MKISILVPIYNVSKYIERCAHSLMEQSYENIEYVFVDDCTPDNSITLLKGVIAKYPHRQDQVKIISHEHNKGLAGARITALNSATGDYVVHVEADDYIAPHAGGNLSLPALSCDSELVDAADSNGVVQMLLTKVRK